MIFTAASREKTVRKTYSSFSCGRHGRPAVRPPASGQASGPRPPPAPPCGLAVLPPGLGTCQGVRVDPPASQLAAPEPPGSAPSEPATTSFSKLPRTPLPSRDRRPRRGPRLLCSGTRPPPVVRKGRSLTSEGAGVGDKGRGPPAGRHLDVVQEPCCLVTQRVFLKVSGGSEAVGVSLLSLTPLPVGPRLSPASSELPVYSGAWCRDRVSVDPWGQSWDLHSTESHKGWAGCPARWGPGGLLGR